MSGLTALSGTLHIGLRVGDILIFKPESSIADGLDVTAMREAATSQSSSTGAICALDPAVIAHDGGSIVIERKLTRESAYEVHWAGLRTSSGKNDCAASANVTLSQMDLQTLVDAIQGFSLNSSDYLS